MLPWCDARSTWWHLVGGQRLPALLPFPITLCSPAAESEREGRLASVRYSLSTLPVDATEHPGFKKRDRNAPFPNQECCDH